MAIKTDQKKTVFKITGLSKKYSPEDIRSIGEDILQYIRDRSAEGLGPGRKKWSGEAGRYSDSYAKSLDFKIAGKSKKNVDQTLSGNMLTELELIEEKPGSLSIGYSKSNPEQGKAEGNIIGSYGKKENKSKARNFIKLTHNEVKSILADYPLRSIPEVSKTNKKNTSTEANVMGQEIFSDPLFNPFLEFEE